MTKPRLLFVDDQPEFACQALDSLLPDYWISLVFSLADASEFLEREPFAIVLIDFDLDEGRGAELVSRARCMRPEALLVGISSHELGKHALLRAGCDAACLKSDGQELGSVIEMALLPVARAEQA